jgi:MoaA/NifB/PqqE/SkfB family radical SAM enzyme
MKRSYSQFRKEKDRIISELTLNSKFYLSRKLNMALARADTLQITLTNRCNLNCRMCTIVKHPSLEKDELTTEEIFRLISEGKEMGIPQVVLTGGEPLLRKDIFQICDFCRKKAIRSIMTTNGTLIDGPTAEKIVLSGLSHIHFSIDGMEKAHDFFRGKGAFSKVVNAIKLVDAARKKHNSPMSIGFACTVMEENVADLPEMMKFFDELNVDSATFQPLVKDNTKMRDRSTDTPFWVSEKSLFLLDKSIDEVRRFKGKRIRLYEEPEIRLFKKYYRNKVGKNDWKCFGGYKTLIVALCTHNPKPEFHVYICHGLCGNVREKSLKNCWNSQEAAGLRKKITECKTPCLQSCHSRTASESLKKIFFRA